MTFLSLIKSGIITYDWRGYTSKEGKYKGKTMEMLGESNLLQSQNYLVKWKKLNYNNVF